MGWLRHLSLALPLPLAIAGRGVVRRSFIHSFFFLFLRTQQTMLQTGDKMTFKHLPVPGAVINTYPTEVASVQELNTCKCLAESLAPASTRECQRGCWLVLTRGEYSPVPPLYRGGHWSFEDLPAIT